MNCGAGYGEPVKAVFDTKHDSAYDDNIANWYHFPPRYLQLVSECVGDWVVYRQPRSGGGQMGYFGGAKFVGVRPDPEQNNHFYADIQEFLPFDTVVPWREKGRYAETSLRNLQQVSRAGQSIQGRSV